MAKCYICSKEQNLETRLAILTENEKNMEA